VVVVINETNLGVIEGFDKDKHQFNLMWEVILVSIAITVWNFKMDHALFHFLCDKVNFCCSRSSTNIFSSSSIIMSSGILVSKGFLSEELAIVKKICCCSRQRYGSSSRFCYWGV
jgi:hypothetical protein